MPRSARTRSATAPISAGLSTIVAPAAASASFFACAVPAAPTMMAPAWPMRRPGGAVAPAMKAITGFDTSALMYSAACCSATPPISPMKTTAGGADAGDAGALQEAAHPPHVHSRNAFRDADDDRDAGVRRLQDGVRRERRRDEDERAVRLRGGDRLARGIEDGHAVHLLAAAARRDAGDDVRPVLDAAACLE